MKANNLHKLYLTFPFTKISNSLTKRMKLQETSTFIQELCSQAMFMYKAMDSDHINYCAPIALMSIKSSS